MRIDRYETPKWPQDPEFREQVFHLIDVAFAQRRKTVRNAFAEWAGSGNESASRLLAASINPSLRGEMLDIKHFVTLLQRSADWHVVDEAPETEAEPAMDDSQVATS